MTAVIEGTAREITEPSPGPQPLLSSPPGLPVDDAPITIPPDRLYIVLTWDDAGERVSIRCHPSFTAEQAQIILARAGLIVLDTAVAKAAEQATE